MKIAIVGTSDLSNRIYDVLSEEKDLDLVIYEGEKLRDIVEESKKIGQDVDGIIFTGIAVYCHAIHSHNYNIPFIYTDRDMTSITEAFYHLYRDYHSLSNIKLGIDTVDIVDLEDFFDEFDIEVDSYELLEYEFPKDEEDYIEEYIRLYEAGRINCIMTASCYIYDYFSQREIPTYRLMTSNSQIRADYHKLRGRIENMDLDDRMVMVQIIEIKCPGGRIPRKEEIAELELIVDEYAREMEGMYRRTSECEFMVLSNKRTISNKENQAYSFSMRERTEKLGLELAIGIGEGDTLYKSEQHARNALRRSKLDEGSSIFYYDGCRVVGPLLEENQLEYSTAKHKNYDKLVREIGISYQYIDKIDSVKKKLGRDEFTSRELAELLLISERTANRLIKKIIDSGYGEESGHEVSLGVGRPRRKIRIYF